ncbi:MAG TPA: AMP-binding protein [Magnetospirillaceae bacterium]|nr:AMP-binding protein [Magnetospirillaceae bacterium]
MNLGKQKAAGALPQGLGPMIEEIVSRYRKREAIRFESRVYSYQDLDLESNRVAGGLKALGIRKGDRVAVMLPNIPEFVFSFFGIQKLGAIAVPFNTMYKGREISYILQDSGARAIICLSNFANLIQEVQSECPALEHVIVTGQRTFVFVEPEGSVNVQMVFDKSRFADPPSAFHTIGGALVSVFKDLGVADAWYSHIGAVRANGKKLATIVLSEIENLYICNVLAWLAPMDTAPLFKVIYVPPEIKERALEPMTSVRQESGKDVAIEDFRDALLLRFGESLGVDFEPGKLTRDELIAYEKNRALVGRI